MDQLPTGTAEYILRLENALITINRLYMNTAIKQIVADALEGRELFLDLSEVEIPTQFTGDANVQES